MRQAQIGGAGGRILIRGASSGLRRRADHQETAIAYEAVVPLLAITLLAVVLGFASAHLILSGLTEGLRGVGVPDPRYLIALAGSVGLAVLAIVSTVGSVRKNTQVSATRFE